ncbi:MAG: ACT domain-containing protein [bacterium]|nr:ACT domain-containing protein [bacterium]
MEPAWITNCDQMAEKDLGKLLKGMKPEFVGGKYFLASVPESEIMVIANYLDYITCIYREEEGLTLVFSEEIQEEMGGISEEKVAGPFALITLSVNSDLFAVGFLAKITGALAKEGISVNAFSAYFHDHLLVPYERKKDAMKVLEKLSGRR